jgi:amino acid adenylation domain-containing protein
MVIAHLGRLGVNLQKNPLETNLLQSSVTIANSVTEGEIHSPGASPGERRFISATQLQEQIDFWRGVLADAPSVLALPTDRPRPTQPDHAGAFLPLELDEGLTAKLEALGLRHGANLFTILLAGWGALLARVSGQDDVVIGTRAARSWRGEAEALAGCSVNSLALRLDLSSGQTVGTLIERAKARFVEAEQNQDLPFELVVQALRLPGGRAYTPVFQAMFVWRRQNEVGPDFPDATAAPADETPRYANFDLTLSLAESGGRVVGWLEYSAALFDRETMERHAGYLRRLLEAMADGDDQTIDRLPLLGEAERHRLLVEWNATEEEYSRDKCAHEMFEAQVARTPYAIAVRDEETRVTYAELNAQSNQLAHGLRALGVGPDTPVAICLERSVAMVVGLMAILKAGGAYVPLDPSLPVGRLAYMLKDSAPKAALTQGAARTTLQAALDELTEKPRILDVVADASEWADQPDGNLVAAGIGLTPHSLAYIIYTSGSTGQPKGVMVEHGGLVNRLEWMQSTYGIGPQDTVLQKTPFGFDVSVWEFFWTLMEGSRLFMAKPGGHKSPAYLSEAIRSNNVTTMHFVPSMLQSFVDSGEATNLPSLKRVMCSGEALPIGLVRQFHELLPAVELHNLYGPTEATVDVTAWTSTGAASDRVPIGRPISNTQIYLLDAHGEPVPRGVAGEIFIGGVNVARGYLNRPDLTAERFLPNPFIAGGRLYKTGDLGRFLPNGDIEYLGRNDFQVKIRGFRIELEEIEARLAEHEGIREAVVLAREDATGDKRLVADFVASTQAEDIDPRTLRAYLLASLPDYMVPAAYVRMDKFTLTGNGKLDRRALPVPLSDAYGARGYAAPEGEAEEALARICATILMCERVGRRDNFFELGGNSLLGLRLISEINRTFDTKLPLGALFSEPTIEGLARRLAHRGETLATTSLVPLHTGHSGAPLFMVHWHVPDLARRLGLIRSVYGLSFGLPAMGREVGPPRPERVEDLAAHYIDEMRTVQPHGPYYLIGHSVGGCIAFEMAQQLAAQGDQVAFLALLDSYAAYHRLLAPRRLSLGKVCLNILKTRPKDLLRFGALSIMRKIEAVPLLSKLKAKLTPPDKLLRRELISFSLIPYEPKPYSGPVHLFQCEKQYRYIVREDRPLPESTWQGLTPGGLTVKSLPLGHMEMIEEPLVGLTAQAIDIALNDLGKTAD